ncbi:hypothetical protein [Nocardia gipuzkoensis]
MTAARLTGLTDAERARATTRFEVLRPHLDDEIPLSRTGRSRRRSAADRATMAAPLPQL